MDDYKAKKALEAERDKYKAALEQIAAEDWKLRGNNIDRGRFGQIAIDAIGEKRKPGMFIAQALGQRCE